MKLEGLSRIVQESHLQGRNRDDFIAFVMEVSKKSCAFLIPITANPDPQI